MLKLRNEVYNENESPTTLRELEHEPICSFRSIETTEHKSLLEHNHSGSIKSSPAYANVAHNNLNSNPIKSVTIDLQNKFNSKTKVSSKLLLKHSIVDDSNESKFRTQ